MASDQLLEIEGIKGESTDSKHPNTIEIESQVADDLPATQLIQKLWRFILRGIVDNDDFYTLVKVLRQRSQAGQSKFGAIEQDKNDREIGTLAVRQLEWRA